MTLIFNFLTTSFQEIKQHAKEDYTFLALLGLLCTIPLSYAINNVFLIAFLVSLLIGFKKTGFALNKSLILPILLYGIMVLSLFWTIDSSLTKPALSKELALLLIPLGFLFWKENTPQKTNLLLKYYSYTMVLYVVYYLIKALIRFLYNGSTDVFFYHELVTKDVNAIHVSVYVAIAFFYFAQAALKPIYKNAILLLLAVFIILLSSKNIVLVFGFLTIVYYFFYTKAANKMRLRNIFIVFLLAVGALFLGKLKDRFLVEYNANTAKSITTDVISNSNQGVHNVSMKEAWSNKTFSPNDFFSGTAFRVYQTRLFFEFLKEEPIFWTGFGLNASYNKIEEKALTYNVFQGDENAEGYQKKNFHNQYVQVFAELGVFAFLLLVLMLVLLLKKGIKRKDFISISFAVLMISLFLTESFLWRQRGVVFFSLFYCLLLTQNKSIAK